MDEGRGLSVEAMQTIGVLVDEGIVLRDELPADFGGIDSRVVGHDGAADGAKTLRLGTTGMLDARKTHREGRGRYRKGTMVPGGRGWWKVR